MEKDSRWYDLLKDCDFEKAKKPIFHIMTMMSREIKIDYQGASAREEIRIAVENFFINPTFSTALTLLNTSSSFESAFVYAKEDYTIGK